MGGDDMQKLKDLSNKTYKEQAVFFLNAFWATPPAFGENLELAEKIWGYVELCHKLDPKGEEGHELDEFNAHRLLEKIDQVLTVKDMRKALEKIDLDFNKYVSLAEFLIYLHKVDFHDLVNAPQGEADQAKIQEAADAVDAAKAAIDDCTEKAKVAKEDAAKARDAEASAFADEEAAKEAEAKAVEAENTQKDLEEQVKQALAELQREEDAYKSLCDKLEADGNDDSKGIVSRNRAKNELAQLKCKDPLPLQRAKINQEAVVRRQQRATRSAGQARAAASQARASAEESRKQAEAARAAADHAAEEAEMAVTASIKAFQDAEAALEKIKLECKGAGKGKLWWLDRELEEAKKYMSQAQLARLAAKSS